MNNYVKTLINRMAVATGTELTDDHFKILAYAYDYYERFRVGPLYQNIHKHTGLTREDIERLFPHGLHSVYTWVGIHIHSTDDGCKPVPKIWVDDLRHVYLDHNATTYPHEKVIRLMQKYIEDEWSFGNPSSSTKLGREAYSRIQSARNEIAHCLNVQPNEIVFTGGGSEANNLAIKGIAFSYLKEKGHLITSRAEHSSVLKTMQYLESIGFEVTYLDVYPEGMVCSDALKESIKPNTILVAIMAANNEIGTINPLRQIGRICKQAGVPLMVDAVQAFGRILLQPKSLGISMMSMSGHKIYGPKGVGALFVDEALSLVPLIHGGEQEMNYRAGTENVSSIEAFGEAARLIYQKMATENRRLEAMQMYFWQQVKRIEPGCILHGSKDHRVPHNLSIGFPDVDSGALLLSLNQIGVYVSAGSACSAGSREHSHVLRAIGVDTERYGTIRFSFGMRTTKEDLDYVLKYLPVILQQLKMTN
ncbi:TusE/DsrC/DsvC family sulfur relay protein [candidate division KSB1 bacterium]|nr:TusE/DsrC/DsvC family sulfur relay protein [candidate division KSB1 bacterium]